MKWFSLKEFYYSLYAKKHNIDNIPPKEIIPNIEEFILNILDPLRDAWTLFCEHNKLGHPSIIINSAYRCKELNKKVGGSDTSVHQLGYAADIVPANGNMKRFQDFVTIFLKSKYFDQLIYEKPVNGIASWLHIGYKNNKGEQRREIKTIK